MFFPTHSILPRFLIIVISCVTVALTGCKQKWLQKSFILALISHKDASEKNKKESKTETNPNRAICRLNLAKRRIYQCNLFFYQSPRLF